MPLYFNGTTNFLTISGLADLPDNPWTVFCWYYPIGVSSQTYTKYLLYCADLWLYGNGDAGNAYDNTLTSYCHDAGGDYRYLYSNDVGGSYQERMQQQWHPCAIQRAYAGFRLFHDDTYTANTINNVDAQVISPLLVGKRSAGTSFWPGYIAELAIWDRDIGRTIINALAAGASPGDFSQNRIFYMPLRDSYAFVAGGGVTVDTTNGSGTFSGVDHPIAIPEEGSGAGTAAWVTARTAWVKSSTPNPAVPVSTITIKGCRNTYGCGTFSIRSSSACTVTLTAESTPASEPQVDLHWIKRWIQESEAARYDPIELPELLLKDPTLVEINYTTNPWSNTVTEPTEDATELQTLTLAANVSQQVWVTVQIPAYCAAGTYTSDITITSSRDGEDDEVDTIHVSVEVQPFDLLTIPGKTFSIYYRGIYSAGAPTVGHSYKTETQYKAELADMLAHGVDNPTLWEQYTSTTNIQTVMGWRAAVGMTNDPIYWVLSGIQSVDPESEVELDAMKVWLAACRAAMQAGDSSVDTVYCYGIDEATGAELSAQIPIWQHVHEVPGCYVFAAGMDDAYGLVGDYLDLPLNNVNCSTDNIALWHGLGKRILRYGEPGMETQGLALSHRTEFGFWAYRLGYDGLMPFAYQFISGSPWDDFDGATYHEICCTYPTLSGPIRTLQWEMIREAIYDQRYAYTYQCYGGTVPNESTYDDMDTLREELIDGILAYQEGGGIPSNRIALILKT